MNQTSLHYSPPGIYIHIPFCIKKCLYCDFYSVTDTSLQEPFVAALLKEIHGSEPLSEKPDTLYIGGGTPSVLGAKAIHEIISAVDRRFSLSGDAEITLEVNPGTITPDTMRAYQEAGVNRINIGIQSFNDDMLSILGRCHSGMESRQAVSWARDVGFDNIGLDLIYGVPDQTSDGWRNTLEETVSFQPEHLSCYMLTYEPGTPMDRMRETGDVHPLEEDTLADLFDTTLEVLVHAGYEHYEISNFSRSLKDRSRHNQKYWNHTSYLGFGPAAHSFSGNERRWNIRGVSPYIQRVEEGLSPCDDTETLTQEQLITESIYLGLRTTDGIDTIKLEKRFGFSFLSMFSSLISMLEEDGLLTIVNGRCALTHRGMRFHDFITQRFVDEIA